MTTSTNLTSDFESSRSLGNNNLIETEDSTGRFQLTDESSKLFNRIFQNSTLQLLVA